MKKLFKLFISITTLCSIVCYLSINVNASNVLFEDEKFKVYSENYNDSKKIYLIDKLNDNNSKIFITNNEKVDIYSYSNNIMSNKKTIKKEIQANETADVILKASSKSTWLSKVKEKYRNRYWYQWKRNKLQMRIGCNVNYVIDSKKYFSKCNNYKKAIEAMNTNMSTIRLHAGGFAVTTIITAVATAISGGTLTPAVVATLQAVFPGITLSCINEAAKSPSLYKNVQDKYDHLKRFGKKY